MLVWSMSCPPPSARWKAIALRSSPGIKYSTNNIVVNKLSKSFALVKPKWRHFLHIIFHVIVAELCYHCRILTNSNYHMPENRFWNSSELEINNVLHFLERHGVWDELPNTYFSQKWKTRPCKSKNIFTVIALPTTNMALNVVWAFD